MSEPRVSESVAVRAGSCCVCGRAIREGERMLTILDRGLVETSHAECPARPTGGTAAAHLLADIKREIR